MKNLLPLILIPTFLLVGCGQDISSQVINVTPEIEVVAPKPPLIIIWEGGPSGSLFERAADTYEKVTPGERFTVHSGDQFIAAIQNYVEKHGPVQHLEYFWHGNSVGLYINQAPNINGALYANDPRVDKDYIAASIYELPPETFVPGGSVRFNGCNVAEWNNEGKSNLAQNFANHFQITADAPLWPTEFSQVSDSIKPYSNSNALWKDFRGPVYLVPTDPKRWFIELEPQNLLSQYTDVYEDTSIWEWIKELEKKWWTSNLMWWNQSIQPWKNTTYWELLSLCNFMSPEHRDCESLKKYPANDMVRNLLVLSTLIDATGLPITQKITRPWYQKYISYGMEHTLLTNDFIHKKWYTRGEMLELAGNLIRYQQKLQ